MRKKTKRELVEWEERSKLEPVGDSFGPRMTMSVLMQNRVSPLKSVQESAAENQILKRRNLCSECPLQVGLWMFCHL